LRRKLREPQRPAPGETCPPNAAATPALPVIDALAGVGGTGNGDAGGGGSHAS